MSGLMASGAGDHVDGLWKDRLRKPHMGPHLLANVEVTDLRTHDTANSTNAL